MIGSAGRVQISEMTSSEAASSNTGLSSGRMARLFSRSRYYASASRMISDSEGR